MGQNACPVEHDDRQVSETNHGRKGHRLSPGEEHGRVHKRVDIGDDTQPADSAQEVDHGGVARQLDNEQQIVHEMKCPQLLRANYQGEKPSQYRCLRQEHGEKPGGHGITDEEEQQPEPDKEDDQGKARRDEGAILPPNLRQFGVISRRTGVEAKPRCRHQSASKNATARVQVELGCLPC